VDLNNGKILVTGADGFIGSHLTEALVCRGCDVRALVMYNSFGSCGWLDSSEPQIHDSMEIIPGDIRDPYAVRDAMRDCSVVFHLAALIAIPYSYRAPASYIDTNVYGTLNVVQSARDLGVAKVVHTSTSEVYGTAQFVPITEQHPLQGQSPYAASKIAADQIAMSFFFSFETPVATIRPFNTYGPRQSSRAVIPTIITQMANGSNRIQLGSVNPTRDFSFVDDIIGAFIAVAESDRTVGEVVNAGSSFEISIRDTARQIAELMETEVEIEIDDTRLRPGKSEVERLYSDSSKLSNLTKWKPKHGGLDGFKRGLKQTITWFQNPNNLAHYKADKYAI